MTDRERWAEFLTAFGIEWEQDQESVGAILLCEGSTKIVGYPYFFTVINFDPTGKFVSIGAYE